VFHVDAQVRRMDLKDDAARPDPHRVDDFTSSPGRPGPMQLTSRLDLVAELRRLKERCWR